MNVVRLKAKNQITLPMQIIRRLHLHEDELFQVDIKGDCIRLIPVEIKPKYSRKDFDKIDKIVKRGAKKAKLVRHGSGFSRYIDDIK